MKTLITVLRIVFGIFAGLVGCLALVNAPYQLLNKDFSLAGGGPLVLASLALASLMFWIAWQLIRGLRIQ